MKQIVFPSLAAISVLMMMPASANATPTFPISDVLAELNSARTMMTKTGTKSKWKKNRRSRRSAQRSAQKPQGHLSAGTSQSPKKINSGTTMLLFLVWCRNRTTDSLLPMYGTCPPRQ